MKITIPELEEIRNEIAEMRAMLENLSNVRNNDYISRHAFVKEFGISQSCAINYEKKGILKPRKLGGKVFYKRSEITSALENETR